MEWPPEGENDAEAYPITHQHYALFHTIDRALYTILAIHLCRDPAESLHVVALLLWLERNGFPHAVKSVLSLPRMLVGDLADEAMACLNFIFNHGESSSDGGADVPLMRGVIGRRISARFLRENRHDARRVISKIIDTVCVRALNDIMQKAFARRNPSPSMSPASLPDRPAFPGMRPRRNENENGNGNGNADDHVVINQHVPVGHQNRRYWLGREEAEAVPVPVPPDDRTLFVTFSKGYPVHEWEVVEFLTRAFGDCVEALHMQEVQTGEQPLFARVVFQSASTIDQVLGTSGKAKFIINGKHVWARKFVPKRNHSHRAVHQPPPPPPPQPYNLPPHFPFYREG
ncbi:uncharacterized protein LOC115740920 [Rhodamnia argentea]|uniref:Uncharacterized protein LOC115740920 n=1 Tax=Rhodamnia argentea TaxID=178133 RepID=A0A8B8P6P5_9MYRT|nr:uncharacterized protein LOC115740920 [Rhodamnia argentea]